MKSFFNRKPLTANSITHLSLGKIKPDGWLQEQISIIAEAFNEKCGSARQSTKNTDYFLKLEGVVPYAFAALVHLAFVSDNELLKKQAECCVEALVKSQREDGLFASAEKEDYLSRTICLKAVYAYLEATGDRRILAFIDRYLKYLYKTLQTVPLRGKACAVGIDNIYVALKIYNITGQAYLLELCKKLRTQLLDWTSIFHTFPNIQPLSKSMPWKRLKEGIDSERKELIGEEHPFFAVYYNQSNGENVAYGLKQPALIGTFKTGYKEQSGFRVGWEKLMRYHGTAAEMYTCDRHLNGADPARGIDTAAIGELIASLSDILDLTNGDSDICEKLEKAAYNLLPAALSSDASASQKLEQVNQINCSSSGHIWYNAEEDANVFKDELTREYCALVRAWPYFAASLWYATEDDGLYAAGYAPCTVSHVVDSVPIKLSVGGGYPFADEVQIKIEAKRTVEIPLYLRIPHWALNPMIILPGGEIMSVKAGETACLREKWENESVIKLLLNRDVRITSCARHSAGVEAGPLLMALNLKAEESAEGTKGAISASQDWAYGFSSDEPMKLVYSDETPPAFKNRKAALSVHAKIYPCPQWTAENGDTGSIPVSPKCQKADVITAELVPFGFTDLRIAQFPVVQTD